PRMQRVPDVPREQAFDILGYAGERVPQQVPEGPEGAAQAMPGEGGVADQTGGSVALSLERGGAGARRVREGREGEGARGARKGVRPSLQVGCATAMRARCARVKGASQPVDARSPARGTAVADAADMRNTLLSMLVLSLAASPSHAAGPTVGWEWE